MTQRMLLRPSFGFRPVVAFTRTTRLFSTVMDAPISPASQQSPPEPPTSSTAVFQDAVEATLPRTSWTKEQISDIYNTSLIELTYAAVSPTKY
jgi:biotin synthase